MTVLNELKPGRDEKLYERALIIELRARGHVIDSQKRHEVYYRKELIGTLVPDLVVDGLVLAERGVEAAFMVSGGQMMHLIDAVGRVRSIRYYCNHHEQACAMAAEAYARLSGRPGLCYATGGPGGTNTLTGLVGAFQDSIPM